MIAILSATISVNASGQNIPFDKGSWQTTDISKQHEYIHVKANLVRVDTVITEDISTGEMTMTINTEPLSRYHSYSTGLIHQQIQIRQEQRVDTTWVEALDGSMRFVTQYFVHDIPEGIFREYSMDGPLKLEGHVSGIDPDGMLHKVGTWTELNQDGTVLWSKEFQRTF